MNRIKGIILGMIISLGCTLGVGVLNAEVSKVKETLPEEVLVWGTIVEKEDHRIRIQNSSEVNNDIILNVSDQTVIIDAVTGKAIAFEDLQKGEVIYSYIGPAVTASLPPQGSALAIIANIPQDYRIPTYMKVGEIRNQGKECIWISNRDGSTQAIVSQETQLMRYVPAGMVGITSIPTLDEIKEGTRLFLWFEQPIPNQGKACPVQKAQKVLIIPNEIREK